jgi:hypothetical protein
MVAEEGLTAQDLVVEQLPCLVGRASGLNAKESRGRNLIS